MLQKLKTASLHPIGSYLGKDGAISTQFVRSKRKQLRLTQLSLAQNAGVDWRFVKELKAGKPTLRIGKVSQVLALFGYEVAAVPAIRPTEEEVRHKNLFTAKVTCSFTGSESK